jgi:anti-sigma factor RsiW
VSWDPEELTGYVDGELPADARARMDEHLAGCPECREEVSEERALRGRLKTLPEPSPSAGFERLLRQRLRAARPHPLRFLVPLAASLVAVLLWAGGSPPVVAWELARDHDHCFSQDRLPAEMFTTDPYAAGERFAPGNPALLNLPERAGELELVGARRCPLADRKVVHLYYASQKRQVSVFLVPDGVRVPERYATESGDHAVRILRISGAVIGVVGADEDDVAAFEQALLQTRA